MSSNFDNVTSFDIDSIEEHISLLQFVATRSRFINGFHIAIKTTSRVVF